MRRVRTNTPLQALTLLNDPASFEAARALAARIVLESGGGSLDEAAAVRARAAYGVKVVLSREAKAEEIDRIVRLFVEERAHYASARQAAATVAGASDRTAADVPERAAWTIVANVLLNLDEAVTKM